MPAKKTAAKKPAAKNAAKTDSALHALVKNLEARVVEMERALEVQLSVKLDRSIG